MPAQLTFFCELPGDRLRALFADPALTALLAEHGCGVAMALIDLSAERAEVVRALTAAGVPVTAWLVLDELDGYWLSLDNVQLARDRWRQIRDWAQVQRLQFARVGLDIEAPHDDAVGLVEAPFLTLARLIWLRRTRRQWRDAMADLHRLVAEVRADAVEIETYQFPIIADERAARSTLLQRVLGIADVRVDREVLMLYRSTLPAPWGETLIDAYGDRAEAIAIGITGGGVAALEATFAPRQLDLQATLDELARARRHTERLYVFSLEGCVEQGWLAELLRAELPQPLAVPGLLRTRVGRVVARVLLGADRLVGRFRAEVRGQLP
jgi:hypothetical protein